MSMTKKELTRLVRLSRGYGSFGLHDGERGTVSLVCPVHREALDRVGERAMAHRYPVHCQPWEKVNATLVADALTRHLDDAETNGEPCDNVRLAVR